MKRVRSLLVPLVALFLVAALAPPAASRDYNYVYPFPFINKRTLDQYEEFQMQPGWFEGNVAWFISTDISKAKLACSTYFNYTLYWMGITYAPRLTQALQALPVMYVVTNYNQGPLFSAAPADFDTGDNYAGVWKVVFITYKSKAFRHAVTNTRAYHHDTNPAGLPPSEDADYDPADPGDATLVANCPIVALGQLGGPWYPASAGRYRIPQGRVIYDYTSTKIVWLPYWYVYCTDPITKHLSVRRTLVTDVYEPDTVPENERLIPKIGANPAPGLATISINAMRAFYFLNEPKPWSQYPVMSSFPSNPYEPWRNEYADYSPLAIYTVLNRLKPPGSVVRNLDYLKFMLNNPPETPMLEEERDTQRLNAPILTNWGQVL